MLKDNMTKKLEPKVFRTRLMGGNSHYNGKTISITIPRDYAEFYHLSKPTNVLLTPTENGILLRKLEVPV